MRTVTRLAATGISALALTATLAAPVSAQTGGGANNLVQVVNTTSESFAARAGVQAAPYGGTSTQSTNLARADSRDCTRCRSQAAALQAVFLTGDASTVEVANAAVATNSNCQSCTAYAYAYQYVITSDRAVSLSSTGQEQIRSIQARATAVINHPGSTLEDFAALDAQLDALAAELRDTIDNELRSGWYAARTRGYRDSDHG